MSTMTAKKWRLTLWSLLAGMFFFAGGQTARAAVGSDISGAILIFPKIVVDTSGVFGVPTDTELQITNTSNSMISARCYWVNATSHCSNNPTRACQQNSDCDAPGVCQAGWTENDFRFTLTKRQPISFNAADGMNPFPLTDAIHGPGGQSNNNTDGSPSAIPPVPEDPFIGELKCIQVNPTDFTPTIGYNPANNAAGDLAGHATILRADSGAVDARKYNGIALQSTTINNHDETLVIGGPDAEYDGCPHVLILDHMFDNAIIPSHRSGAPFAVNYPVVTDLTVIPCSENFRLQENDLGGAVLQFLVYNEFEQRFSASTRFAGFREVQLSDIDTRAGTSDNNKSIFNVAVQGTLSGQTRIRAVQGTTRANGVLGIAERFFACASGPNDTCTSAENLHFTGSRNLSDQIILSPELP